MSTPNPTSARRADALHAAHGLRGIATQLAACAASGRGHTMQALIREKLMAHVHDLTLAADRLEREEMGS